MRFILQEDREIMTTDIGHLKILFYRLHLIKTGDSRERIQRDDLS